MKSRYESEHKMLRDNKNAGLIDEPIERDLYILEKRIKFYKRRMAKVEKKLSKI